MLVVFAGKPGTGKTTLAGLLATELRAAHLRVDAIEAAVIRSDLATHPIGPVGYLVAHEVTRSCLRVGTPVVVDAVSPATEARAGWSRLATAEGAPLRMIEVRLSDEAEHRRRVEQRVSDVEGLAVPSWAQVVAREYHPWDEQRDGPRLVVDNDRTVEDALNRVRAYVHAGTQTHSPG